MQYGDARLKRRWGIFFLCIVSIGGVSFCLKKASYTDPVCRVLRSIPIEERCFLDYFFRTLLLTDSGIFVLNGSKPAGRFYFFGTCYYQSTIHWRGFYRSTLFKKGFEVWKKYEHLFPSKKYCLSFSEDEEKGIRVLLLNKPQLSEVIANNIEDFKRVLGSNINLELLLAMMANEPERFWGILDQHDALEGIVLGYGRHNSWLFHQKEVFANAMPPLKGEILEKHLLQFNQKLQPTPYKRSALHFSSMPFFMCDPAHPETHELWQKYKQQRKECASLFRGGNFLEIVLKKFVS